jgi:hypothetical protein
VLQSITAFQPAVLAAVSVKNKLGVKKARLHLQFYSIEGYQNNLWEEPTNLPSVQTIRIASLPHDKLSLQSSEPLCTNTVTSSTPPISGKHTILTNRILFYFWYDPGL